MRARVCLRLSAALSLHRDSPCSVTRRGLRDPNNKQGQQDEPVMVDGSAASTPTFARAASQPCLSACQWLSLSLLGRRRGGWESEDERERGRRSGEPKAQAPVAAPLSLSLPLLQHRSSGRA